jgi:hypothetical protein
MNKTVYFEISSDDSNQFNELSDKLGLDFRKEGESFGLDGISLLELSVEILPPLIGLIGSLLATWLQQRKKIKVTIGDIKIETDDLAP